MSTRRSPLLAAAFVVLPLAALLSGCGSGSGAARSSQAPSSAPGAQTVAASSPATTGSGITVTGTAQVHGTPDTLDVSFTVATTASHAADAFADNNRRTAALLAALKADGVADRDIATTGLQVGPQWSPGGVITGYHVQNSVSVKLRDLTRAGTLIDHAVAVGGDALRVGGISLTIDATSPLLAAARTQAVQAAHDRAAALAAAAGAHLGAVRAISDQALPAHPYATPASAAASGAASSSVPVQPGTQTLSVEVTVTYELAA